MTGSNPSENEVRGPYENLHIEGMIKKIPMGGLLFGLRLASTYFTSMPSISIVY